MAYRKIGPPKVVPIPQPDLVLPEKWSRPWFRIRRIAFSFADWRAIDAAMRIACPYLRYYRRGNRGEPDHAITQDMCDQVTENGRFPGFVWATFFPDQIGGRSPLPRLLVREPSSHHDATADDPEFYYVDAMDLAIDVDNPQHVAFARAFYALLGQFSSNRHQEEFLYPEGHGFNPKVTTPVWIGHQVIRWALEDPLRAIFDSRDGRLRPIHAVWRERLGVTADPSAPRPRVPPAPDQAQEAPPPYRGPANARDAQQRRAEIARQQLKTGETDTE